MDSFPGAGHTHDGGVPVEDAPKHSWVVRRGDLLFGAGWYEGIGE